jgi:hypothetical protein
MTDAMNEVGAMQHVQGWMRRCAATTATENQKPGAELPAGQISFNFPNSLICAAASSRRNDNHFDLGVGNRETGLLSV